MENMENLQVRMERNFLTDGSTIPTFVSGREISHRNCFFIGKEIHNSLVPLFKDRILPYDLVEDIFLEVAEQIELMIDNNSTIALDYCKYFDEILTFYMNQSIDYELYEVAQNITRFLAIWKKININ